MRFKAGDVIKVKKYCGYNSEMWISKDGSRDHDFELIEVTIIVGSKDMCNYMVDVTDCDLSYKEFKNSYFNYCLPQYSIHPKNLDSDRVYTDISESGAIELVKSCNT